MASEAEGVSIAAGASLGGKQVACYSAADKRNSFLYVRRGTRMIPVLEALGIEYQILTDGENLETRIKGAVRMMHALKLPVVLLFTGEFTS